MADHGHQLVLYHEELRRLGRRLEVMEQLHLAPSIYVATVVEVMMMMIMTIMMTMMIIRWSGGAPSLSSTPRRLV